MRAAERFGAELKRLRKNTQDGHNGGNLTQERLAELLGDRLGITTYSGKHISNWENGRRPLDVEDREILVALVAVLAACGGVSSRAEANRLLRAGGYRGLDGAESAAINPAWLHGDDGGDGVNNGMARLLFSRMALVGWLEPSALNSPDPPYGCQRLAMMLLRGLVNRLRPDRIVRWILWLLLGWVAYRLLIPLLDWPLGDDRAWLQAALQYGLGALLLPAFIALLSRPAGGETLAERRMLDLLCLTTAYVGFNSLVPLLVGGVALLRYYPLGYFNLPRLTLALPLVVALIWSHAGAVTVPLERRQQGITQFGRNDAPFLLLFALFGPGLAAAIYVFYPGFFSYRSSGWLLLWLLLLLLAPRARRRGEAWLPDWVLVLLAGVGGLPATVGRYLLDTPEAWPAPGGPLLLLLALLTGTLGGLIWIQVLRHPSPNLVPAFILILVWTVVLAVAAFNPAAAVGLALALFILILLLRRRRPDPVLPHPAHAGLLALTTVHFLLPAWPGSAWPALLGYGVGGLLLLLWAYRDVPGPGTIAVDRLE